MPMHWKVHHVVFPFSLERKRYLLVLLMHICERKFYGIVAERRGLV
jgi:hypothetical protein